MPSFPRRTRAFALAAAAFLALLPLAGAQEHEHAGDKGAALVLVDGPADGRALVGAYTHFGFALLDKEGNPVVHQNAQFNVLQGKDVLFSTTDTHEYDGLFTLDLRFTKPGPYQVIASSGEMALGVFEGVAVAPTSPVRASIAFEATPTGPAARTFQVSVSVLDERGAIVPHSDAIVEFRDARTGLLQSRSHLHIHEEPIRFLQGFGAVTDVVATVVGYVAFAEETDPQVPAVVAEFPLAVGALSLPGAPTPPAAPPAPLEQVGPKASADGLTLHAMYDPQNQVGVGQTARLAALVTQDATRAPLAHVDFTFVLTGPRGLLFSSDSLHEYDGMFEHVFTPDVPGLYEGVLTAHEGSGLTVRHTLLVVPPAVPLLGGTGPIELGVDGLERIVAGAPANLTFFARGPAGPAAHSEVDVTVFHDGEPPLYQFKLHTHGSGLTNALLLFPHEGEWKIRIDGAPTVPEASVYLPALVSFRIAAAAPGGTVPAAMEGGAAAQVPGAWAALAALALVAAAALARRR